MNYYRLLFTLSLLFLVFTPYRAQNFGFSDPTPKPPTAPTLPVNSLQNSNFSSPAPSQPKHDAMKAHRENMARQAEQNKQRQLLIEEIEENRETETRTVPKINYELLSHQHRAGASSFKSAFHALRMMAGNYSNFSITKAIFTVENAFYNNTGNFEQFDKNIEVLAHFLKALMPEYGYRIDDNVAKNLMIYRFFTDTLYSKDKKEFHPPVLYDFEDYRGSRDYAKQFVGKVLMENSGQCHSLPLLYLMLAEKLQAEAYLAFAPYHSYIKFPLPSGGYQNVELTSHILTSDAHLLQSGFVSAEALQSKIYLQPYSNKGLLSYCISDLAKEYVWKYGYDNFVEEMLQFSLQLEPKNISAAKLLSNHYTVHFIELERRLGITADNFDQKLAQHPKAADILKQRNAIYDQIDAMGYRYMENDDYERWLNGIMEEGKRQNKSSFRKIEQSLNR